MHPTAGATLAFYRAVLDTPLPRPDDALDPRLRPILARLLAKRPDERYRDAEEVIAAFETALDQLLVAETIATRESLLQAAPLVGRSDELALLFGLLREAASGRGSAWLVGGESGVGKSRLLEEVRTRALVDGTLVVRGQAMRQGGAPYHVWRGSGPPRAPLGGERRQAGVLSAIVHDIRVLLGRDVPEPAALGAEAAQTRLLLAVEEVFRGQPGPVLVILEDLQWVGSEASVSSAGSARRRRCRSSSSGRSATTRPRTCPRRPGSATCSR
jgi:hypothetical protein